MRKEIGASTVPASTSTVAATANVQNSAKRSPASPTMASDEVDWTMSDLMELEVKKLVQAKHLFRSLQKPCCSKRHMIPEGVSGAVGLAVELVYEAVTEASFGSDNFASLRIDEFTGQLASTRVEAISLTAKLSDLKQTRRTMSLIYYLLSLFSA